MYECSSTVSEIQQRRQRLQYRSDWLGAILQEVQLELDSFVNVKELTVKQQTEEALSRVDVLVFVNQLSSILLDFESFEQSQPTCQDLQKRLEQLQQQKSILQSLLSETDREVELIKEILEDLEKEVKTYG